MNAIHMRKLKLSAHQYTTRTKRGVPLDNVPAEHVVDELLPVLRRRWADLVLALARLPGDSRQVKAALRMRREPVQGRVGRRARARAASAAHRVDTSSGDRRWTFMSRSAAAGSGLAFTDDFLGSVSSSLSDMVRYLHEKA